MPEAILAHSAQVAGALFRQTRAIPVVFVNVSDPIGAGFIVSLAQPGGNFTGVLHYEVGIVGKWLAMLKELAPNLTRVALMADPKSPIFNYFVRASETAARPLAIELVPKKSARSDYSRAYRLPVVMSGGRKISDRNSSRVSVSH